jgi:hypothetical protein
MDDAAKERFWAKVEKTDTCWLWRAATTRCGYGVFGLNGKTMYAHRLSLEMALGRPIAEGLEAAHAPIICRNRHCVNPAHLREATKSENELDKRLDGTQYTSGRRGPLTDEVVRAIRADPRVQHLVAKEYGMKQTAISRIKLRKRYAHVV